MVGRWVLSITAASAPLSQQYLTSQLSRRVYSCWEEKQICNRGEPTDGSAIDCITPGWRLFDRPLISRMDGRCWLFKSRRIFLVTMLDQEIFLAISAVLFGMVIGFLAGYAVRSYISYLRHQSRQDRWW